MSSKLKTIGAVVLIFASLIALSVLGWGLYAAFLIIGISCTVCTEAAQRYSYPEYFAIKEMLSIIGT